MRPISRTALGAASAAVLAVTAIAPSVAAPPDERAADRPLTGRAAPAGPKSVTLTLVTGDKVLVTTDASGASAATALPRPDGSTPLVQTRQSGRDLYVYPDTAVSALARGAVDEELFNVTGLIRQGYDDSRTGSVPLIATYTGDTARTAPATPRGAERGQALGVIDGLALKADKKRTAAFWADITAPRSRAGSGLKKLWLDRKVQATLDKSTKQVGADRAWAAGYDGTGTKVAVLDTGADAQHPDLAGRITAAQNFTDSDTTDDRQGHGTHVASTVGGSGAASDGKNKGVAPGAGLMVGKVLNDSGSGAASWIIAGMQWAVDNKADVVSMSLGSAEPTDCTDPMSLAAEELGKNKDTLFVVAAGNLGPSLNTVSSPGCAPGVLTVGAVDRDDTTANFSSRGPTIVSHTLKPEIAAPGVAISAASAGGRGSQAYRAMSGTSMAAPHVAGAAAVVKQRHPEWSAQQVKAALVSSAKSAVPGDVRETGSGRLDVDRAIRTPVLGAPALQGGTFNWPQDSSDRTTVSVPYTNTGDKPVKLSLKVAGVTGNDGSAVRSKVATLGRKSVTVPAGASVEIPLALDPTARLTAAQYGDVTGRVLATATGGVTVSTPFSLYVAPETVTLRVKLIDRAGKPADGVSSVDLIGTDTASGERRFNEGATDQTYQLRPGAYFVSSFIATPDTTDATGQLVASVGYLARPQLNLTKDTTLVLDARKAHRLRVATEDRASETRGATLSFGRSWDDTWLHAGSISGSGTVKDYLVDVQGKAKGGEFEFASFWRAYAPQIQKFSLVGGADLHPRPATTGSVNLDGAGRAEVVDAGTGTPAELAAAGARGKVALVKVDDGASNVLTQARDAEGAGATALLVHRPSAGDWKPGVGYGAAPLPVLGLRADEAAVLTKALGKGKAEVSWKATAVSPFVYNLSFPEKGQVTSDRTYKVRDRKLGSVVSTHESMGVAADFVDTLLVSRPYGATSGASGTDVVAAPGRRTEFYTAGDTVWQKTLSSSFPWGELMTGKPRTYQAGRTATEAWYRGLIVPGAPRDAEGGELLAGERQDNVIGVAPAFMTDTEHIGQQGSFGDIGNVQLSRNGESVGSSGYPFGAFTVPAEDAAYELTLTTAKIGSPAAVWKRSTRTETTWKFRSERKPEVESQGLPLLFPRYDVPADGMKTVPAQDGQRIGLTATGHAGYTPGRLTRAAVSFSYDGGETWHAAATAQQGGRWTATVDHAGAAGRTVTLRTELTDAHGNSVVQTVNDAYAVR
ncbi:MULTISPECIES: S8 family serine peptidase [unclassified Streptomyces]|uniref:S8 family serine peptidase n=1 Tax=unclassified Streptomyces TaxID=2593676 RepID=UPI00081D6414|nr:MULTISPECIES: S8 family serine peptidase [unclassified Streptomyces]MYR92839.1 S8 family serine peptidase [Streptomyces sp. SID4937]SCD41760.1 Serine protease, subtilisin family [Streptomyces sp. ScaeMP-e83]